MIPSAPPAVTPSEPGAPAPGSRPDEELELTGLFPLIRRWFVVILVATTIATLIGLVLAVRATPTYEARADLLVGPLDADVGTMVAASGLAETYVQLAASRSVIEPVAADLGVDRSLLYSGVRATADSKSRFLTVRARAHTAAEAAATANGVANRLVRAAQQSDNPAGRLQMIDRATPPSSPISPRVGLIVPLAGVAGLLGALALVMVLELAGDTTTSVEEVDAATGVRTVAVGRGRGGAPVGTVVATELDLVRPDARCTLLTGVNEGDDGGRIALEVAAAWTAGARGVVVVDAGPGEITHITGLEGPGLGEALGDGGEVAPRALPSGVAVVGMGDASIDEVLDLDAARELVGRLQADGARVVVHAGSPLTSPAALGWARVADVTVLVARREQARRGQVEEAATNLRAVAADLAFSVLHDGPTRGSQPPGSTLAPPGARPEPARR